MLHRFFSIAIGLAMATAALAQKADTEVRIFNRDIHSLKIAPADKPFGVPIIALASDEQLNVNFDLIDYDVHYLRYSIKHCNADWQPSQLIESEYVSGFNQADITDYAQSEGTFTHYFNYNFTFPNEEMKILKSGNYVLQVFEQDDPEKVHFQTRFSVCEKTVDVAIETSSRTDVDYNDAHQQVSFEVTYKPGTIQDPYQELKAVVTQNSRTDNAVTIDRPMMVGGDKVTYDHNPALIFKAGNEYRRMETVHVNSLNMGVSRIEYFEPYYHATVEPDEPRCATQYLYDQTQYGRFTIRNAEATDSHRMADYMITHFTLVPKDLLPKGKIYLQGEFTQGLPLSTTQMTYDAQQGAYTCALLLKQGHYNYQYLFVPDGTSVGLTSPIEGDKYQTINEYLVKIYDRPMGERYDHFVGYAVAFSGR
ncbi:MAG: DUF5103 domain-containing protein [Bacteroidales bacterium]|nr:DUF5103 domain-containing protein [Bacteroidales bacterium]